MKTRPTDAGFQTLVAQWVNSSPDERQGIEERILETFEKEVASFVIDMCGFSRTVAKHGIIPFLGLIQEMRDLVVPAIHAHDGEVVKYIGDDVLAVFDEANDALATATLVLDTLAERNRNVAPERSVRASIGIGYGSTLVIPGVDAWGEELNRAFKLGEDKAKPGEILLTSEAFRQLDDQREELVSTRVTVSGLRMRAYRMHRCC